MKKILITGACGFIGYHLSLRLLNLNYRIYGIDNFENTTQDKLNFERLNNLKKFKNFIFLNYDLSDKFFFKKIKNKYDLVLHLAAKPGVRDSIKDPTLYFKNNIHAFFNIIEFVRINKIKGFIFASSSSVYGSTNKISAKENQKTNPKSFYALTKSIDEQIALYYSKMYGLKTYGLRFFSVYGILGRPDMAYFKFAELALKNKTITINNYGKDKRDFTHINDVVNGVVNLIHRFRKIKNNFEIFNLGSNSPVKIIDIIKLIKSNTQKKVRIKLVKKNYLDPDITNANLNKSKKFLNFIPKVTFNAGYKDFLFWLMNSKKNK